MENILDIIEIAALLGFLFFFFDKMKEIDYIYKYVKAKIKEENSAGKDK